MVKFCPSCKFTAQVSSIFVKPILKSFSYFQYSFKSAWSLYFINVSTFFLFLIFIICSWSHSLYFPYFLSSFSEIPKIIIHSFVFLYLFYLQLFLVFNPDFIYIFFSFSLFFCHKRIFTSEGAKLLQSCCKASAKPAQSRRNVGEKLLQSQHKATAKLMQNCYKATMIIP